MHVRQQIINALMTAVTGLPLTASRVQFAPVHALTVLPALSVLWVDESVWDTDLGDGTGPVETRSVQLTVTGAVMDALDAGASLSEIKDAVRDAVMANSALRALVFLIEYRGSAPAFTGELQLPAGTVAIAFGALYRVKSGYPETVIP